MQASLNRKQYRNFPYITHSKLISLFQSFYPKYARLNFRHGNGRRCGTINIYRQTVTVFVSLPAITNNFRDIPGLLESYRTNKSPSRTRGSYRGWINWHFGFRSWFPPVSRHFETLNSQIKVPQIAAGELSEAGLRQKRLSTSFLRACHSLYSLFLRGSHTSPIFYSVWHSVYNPVKGKRGNVRMSRYLLSFLKKKIIIIITMVQFCSFQWTVLLSVLCYYILSYVVALKLGSLFVSPFPPEFYVKSETKNRAWSQVRQGLDGRGLKLGLFFFFFKFYCRCLQNYEKKCCG